MIKKGVSIRGLSPQMAVAFTIMKGIYDKIGIGVDCVITAGCDGKHKNKSRHYSGDALDFRTRNINKQYINVIVDKIKKALGAEFNVVLHKTHLHVEYDPK